MKVLAILLLVAISIGAKAQKSSKQSVQKNSNAKSMFVAGKLNTAKNDKKAKAVMPTNKKKENEKAVAKKDNKVKPTTTKKLNETNKSKTVNTKAKKDGKNEPTKEGLKIKTNNKTTAKAENIKTATIAKAKNTAKTNNKTTAKTKLSKDIADTKTNSKNKIAHKSNKKDVVKNETKSKQANKQPLIQKIKKVIPEVEVEKEVVHTKQQENEAKFEMLYPTGFFNSEIKEHYGKIQIGTVVYPNESVSFLTPMEQDVECNLDSAIVTDVAADDDGLYIVSLKRHQYTVVMANLNAVDVAVGDQLVQGDLIGIVSADYDYNNKGSMELMLLKNKKIINPEKHLVRKFSPKPIAATVTTNDFATDKPTVVEVELVMDAENEL